MAIGILTWRFYYFQQRGFMYLTWWDDGQWENQRYKNVLKLTYMHNKAHIEKENVVFEWAPE